MREKKVWHFNARCQIVQFCLSTYYVPSAGDTDDSCSGIACSLLGVIYFSEMLVTFTKYPKLL